MNKTLENFNKLNFNFEYKNRLIRSVYDNNEYLKFDTPFLKVLKPIHINTNKKKNIEKRYIILEINEEYNINNELDDFLILVNKLHELSQENVKKNSLKWFNTEFDEIGLDLKVKKPIDKQKDKQFIKIVIPEDNKELLEKIENLEKNEYVMSSIFYKGLKVSNEQLMGEYQLINLTTQKEYENLINENNLIENEINLTNEHDMNNIIEKIENNIKNSIEENEEDNTEGNVEDNTEGNVELNIEENHENVEDNIKELKKNNSKKGKNNKEIKNRRNKVKEEIKEENKYVKLVTRKTKNLIFI